jgi:hypothetical protein
VSGPNQFRLLTVHFGLYQLSVAMAGGFVGAYLLKLGFSLPTALVAYAALLGARLGLRFLSLAIVRRTGFRGAITLGAAIAATQFIPLLHADETLWLVTWLVIVSVAESLYWPIYHAAVAVTGTEGARGRELGLRTAIATLIGVVGPLAGGIILDRFGPVVDFSIASALLIISSLPICFMRAIPAGPVPTFRTSFQGVNAAGVATFAADGWLSSGLSLAWPMILFVSLGSEFQAFGIANAGAGLVGAATGVLCGRAIDKGGRERFLVLVCWAMLLGLVLRAGTSWSPMAGTIANASGAAVMGLYVPVLMSVIYDRAKLSGTAYRFHFAAEAGWDVGACLGCLAAAAVAWATGVPSLAMVPAGLGVGAIYLCVRGQTLARATPMQPEVALAA